VELKAIAFLTEEHLLVFYCPVASAYYELCIPRLQEYSMPCVATEDIIRIFKKFDDNSVHVSQLAMTMTLPSLARLHHCCSTRLYGQKI
jgi:hypothetical protein